MFERDERMCPIEVDPRDPDCQGKILKSANGQVRWNTATRPDRLRTLVTTVTDHDTLPTVSTADSQKSDIEFRKYQLL